MKCLAIFEFFKTEAHWYFWNLEGCRNLTSSLIFRREKYSGTRKNEKLKISDVTGSLVNGVLSRGERGTSSNSLGIIMIKEN